MSLQPIQYLLWFNLIQLYFNAIIFTAYNFEKFNTLNLRVLKFQLKIKNMKLSNKTSPKIGRPISCP